MEDIKIYGHLISGISDDNSSYSNGDNWIAEAHDIYDEEFKNLSEEIVEGSLPIERQDQINRYLYNKVDGIQDKLNNYKLYSIVASLPTSNIDKNKMYIVASEEGVENNIYTEYIYTENNTWEKLGEFKADIDLTPYVKKTQIADDTRNGLMSAEDKIKLDNINEDSLLPQLPSNFGYYFPISRVNPNSADNSTDWYSFEEPSVYNRDDEGPLNSVNVELSVCKAGSDINNVLWDVSIPSVSSNGAGVMTVDDKIKLDNITNDSLLPNTDDVAGGVSILTAGKTSHAGSTQTNVEWSKLSVERNGYELNIRGGNSSNNTIITLPPASNNEAGLLPAYLYTPLNNKQAIISNLKLSNDTNTTISDYIVLTRADYQAILDRLTTNHEAIKETEPIVITLAYTDSESEENSFDYTQQDPEESRILTEEEIQKSNLAVLRNIENLNRPIVIKINDKSYYTTRKTMTEYTSGDRFIYIEIGEIESNYITSIGYEYASKGNSSYENFAIRSSKINNYISTNDIPNEDSRTYGLIMERDFWYIMNKLQALDEQVFGPQKP